MVAINVGALMVDSLEVVLAMVIESLFVRE
jgi:hypothetical protein